MNGGMFLAGVAFMGIALLLSIAAANVLDLQVRTARLLAGFALVILSYQVAGEASDTLHAAFGAEPTRIRLVIGSEGATTEIVKGAKHE